MQPLKAHVHNGRLVLDEPTDLPEGEVVYSQPVDADDMSDSERALHDSLRRRSRTLDDERAIEGRAAQWGSATAPPSSWPRSPLRTWRARI
jgi:hypothetical protein